MASLRAAILAADPSVDLDAWVPALTPPMLKANIATPWRIAAFIGQVSQEAGTGFCRIAEDLNYTHASRICAVFPKEFNTLAQAASYVRQPEKLANACYAGKLGNGGPATGDGWRFRGRGLIQVTGRDQYAAFARWCGMDIDAAAEYAQTIEGAAASACWFWTHKSLNPFADRWDLASITRRINGNAMEGHAERVAMAAAALKALGV